MEDHVRVVDRVFDILEALAMSNKPLGLSAIAAQTEISKSTVHRLLASMLARRYVEKNADGTYTIGYKLIETVSYNINSLELLTEAKPYLNSVMRELGLTSHLGVLEGCDVIYLERMDIYPSTRLYTQVGYRSPAYCSSIGKCLLACLSKEELEDTFYQYQFEKHTKNTITDMNEFKRHLRVVRSQGWAMDNEEFQIGHRCVGAPIFDYRGEPVAAISASGSITKISDEKLKMIIQQVRDAAMNISKRMGYLG